MGGGGGGREGEENVRTTWGYASGWYNNTIWYIRNYRKELCAHGIHQFSHFGHEVHVISARCG